MAPTVLNALLQYHEAHHPGARQDDGCIAGSAPPPAFITRVEEELGWEFIQVYGMTEAPLPVSVISTIRSHLTDLSKAQQTELKSKAGYPMIWMMSHILDGNGDASRMMESKLEKSLCEVTES